MGRTPGPNVANPPTVPAELILWWEAYQDLSTERRDGGSIPYFAIKRYADEWNLDFSLLKTIVWKIDRDYLPVAREHAKRKADQERARQQQQNDSGSLGSGPRRFANG